MVDDGTIEFIGPASTDQVKIRGSAWSSAQIEATLARHPRCESAPGGPVRDARRAARRALVGYVASGHEPASIRFDPARAPRSSQRHASAVHHPDGPSSASTIFP